MSDTTLDNKFDHDSFTLEIMRTGSICNKRSPTFLNKKQKFEISKFNSLKKIIRQKVVQYALVLAMHAMKP